MFLRALVLCLLASPSFGGCVDYLSFAKGVTVTLTDGSTWRVRRDAHEVIRQDQLDAKGPLARYMEGPYGVYPTESTRNGQGTISEFRYARTPPEPTPRMDWTSNVRASSTPIGEEKAKAWREKAHVTAGDVQTVKIGACRYRALEMDMGHLGGPYPTVQHFTYFPDLRFGIQTRITYAKDTVKKAAVVRMVAE